MRSENFPKLFSEFRVCVYMSVFFSGEDSELQVLKGIHPTKAKVKIYCPKLWLLLVLMLSRVYCNFFYDSPIVTILNLQNAAL